MRKISAFATLLLLAAFSGKGAFAGPPFNNLEGVGGIAFNPLAYLADSGGGKPLLKAGDTEILARPRVGAWYVSLGQVNVDWATIGVADTFYKRLEVSYGYETVAPSGSSTVHKNNFGAKLLLVPENALKTKFLPAVSVGTIYKRISIVGTNTNDSGVDFYLAATKLIGQLPRPVLLSGGVLSTNGRATGVFGFDDKRKQVAFANIDVILPHGLVAGYEFRQGAKFPVFKDANYHDVHGAWLANNSLSLVVAYVYAGDHNSTDRVGLGKGLVLSGQYAF
jgi:hypothetical protein